jgi:hypothetical protein
VAGRRQRVRATGEAGVDGRLLLEQHGEVIAVLGSSEALLTVDILCYELEIITLVGDSVR